MDIKKSNKRSAAPVVVAEQTEPEDKLSFYTKAGNCLNSAFSYGYAGLKVVDIMARILTAGALYLKLNEAILNWGAAFLAVTAFWEIVVALLRSYGPNRK